ncbi:hypothetical protein VUR80DRAFT_9756 [Thermomyces stellatus]
MSGRSTSRRLSGVGYLANPQALSPSSRTLSSCQLMPANVHVVARNLAWIMPAHISPPPTVSKFSQPRQVTQPRVFQAISSSVSYGLGRGDGEVCSCAGRFWRDITRHPLVAPQSPEPWDGSNESGGPEHPRSVSWRLFSFPTPTFTVAFPLADPYFPRRKHTSRKWVGKALEGKADSSAPPFFTLHPPPQRSHHSQ